MSKARLVSTAVITKGRSQHELARAYGIHQSWVSRLVARYRTLAEAAGCGRSSAASFLQRHRPPTAEDAR